MTKDNKIRIALWQRNIGGDKAQPIFKGTIEWPDGSEQKVSMWVNGNSNPAAPTYTGVVEE